MHLIFFCNFNLQYLVIIIYLNLFCLLQTGPNDLTLESLGVNFRALSDLFFISEQRKDLICYEISVQMMEIYNEQVRDLLSADGGNKRYPL